MPPPDPKPTPPEPVSAADLDGKSATPVLDNLTVLPARYGYRESGDELSLKANCFELIPNRDAVIYPYTIKVERTASNLDKPTPSASETAEEKMGSLSIEDEGKTDQKPPSPVLAAPQGKKLVHIIKHLFKTRSQLQDLVDAGKLASDFGNLLISTEKLEFEGEEEYMKKQNVFVLEYKGEKSKYRKDRYRISFEAELPSPVHQFLDHLCSIDHNKAYEPGVDGNVSSTESMIQAFNILLRHRSKSAAYEIPIPATSSAGKDTYPTQAVVGSKTYDMNGFNNPTYDLRKNQDLTKGDLTKGVQAIGGYFSSIRPAAARLLVNVNVTTGAFYTPGVNLKEWIDNDKFFGSEDPNEIHECIKGLRVKLKYRTEKDSNDKDILVIKTVAGLARQHDGKAQSDDPKGATAPLSPTLFIDGSDPDIGYSCKEIKFCLVDKATKKEEWISIYKHFKRTYEQHVREKDADDWAINVGTRLRPEYCPARLCEIIPGQNYRLPLTGPQTEKMIKVAQKDPPDHEELITNTGWEKVGLEDQKTNKNRVAFVFDDEHTKRELVQLSGKRLERPELKYGGAMVTYTKNGWNLTKVGPYAFPAKRIGWGVIQMTPGEGRPPTMSIKDHIKTIVTKMDERGITATRKPQDEAPDFTFAYNDEDRTSNLIKHLTSLKAGKNRISKESDRPCQIVFVWLPQKVSAGEYAELKKIADNRVGIHTVFVDGSKKFKPDPSGKNPNAVRDQWHQYWDNVLLKVNLKLGGVNQKVDFSKSVLDFSKTMVLGMDITHPPPGSPPDARSVAGMVTTIDEHLGQWFPTTVDQKYTREEVVGADRTEEVMTSLLGPHLARWKSIHKKYPENILLYRDGVSEGQYHQVVQQEYRDIKSICVKTYAGQTEDDPGQDPPRITLVVAVKRHHLRFYCPKTQGGKEKLNGNPPPGTVVDRAVTSQFHWDFYLQAQFPIKGTARPTHYVVVVDNIFSRLDKQTLKARDFANPAEALQDITHRMSYLLGRATTSTSVCAPAFLADKLCDRARCYKNFRTVDKAIKDCMYYI
ncbi:Ribonuclease H-like domain containing protein [Rhypophila sp. PSN 637]